MLLNWIRYVNEALKSNSKRNFLPNKVAISDLYDKFWTDYYTFTSSVFLFLHEKFFYCRKQSS